MKISAEGSNIMLRDVYNGVGFETNEGQFLAVAMRDNGYEVSSNAKGGKCRHYHIESGVVKELGTPEPPKPTRHELKTWRDAYIAVLGYGEFFDSVLIGKALCLVDRAYDFVRTHNVRLDSIEVASIEVASSLIAHALEIEINTEHGFVSYTIEPEHDEMVMHDNFKSMFGNIWIEQLVCASRHLVHSQRNDDNHGKDNASL